METPTHPPMVRTGSEQPLGDTPDALAEKVAPETTPSEHNKENVPPDTPKLPPKSLRGREQRLREIQNALAGLKVVSTKRPSESFTPPTAKRPRLEAVPTLQLHDADRHKYIHEFFAQYPHFNYNPRFSVTNEFRRMCKSFGWRRSKELDCLKDDDADREYGVARQAFDDAMAQQFNYIYGTDLEDISSWKDLCKTLGIIPIPKGLEECQDVVAATHVNIVDLVETHITGKPVKLFRTEEELSTYTKKSGKFFPRDNAYAGGLLRFLLRHILDL